MYAGTVFLGGNHGELGADAVFEDVTAADRELVSRCSSSGKWPRPAAGFRKSWPGGDSGISRERTGLVEIGPVIARRRLAEKANAASDQLIDSGQPPT